MEKTLLHEDIYVHVDKITEKTTVSSGSEIAFTNNAVGNVVDKGIIAIKCLTGLISMLEITLNNSLIRVEKILNVNDEVVLNFRNGFYTVNGERCLFNDMFELDDNNTNRIGIKVYGGTVRAEYTVCEPENAIEDLMFCTSVDVSTSIDVLSNRNIKGFTKSRKVAHGTHSWSINIIWNEDEENKFNSPTGKLRIRLIDLDGRELESLGNCIVNSIQKSSSDSGDYTLSVSGVCDQIF